jgi:succinyl-diaminopimelate desuccinylase
MPVAATGDQLERMGRLLQALVDIPSVSQDEEAVLARIAEEMPPDRYELIDAADGVRCFLPSHRRPDAPLLLLAGHADTVPLSNATLPSRRDGTTIVGRGAADMKAGLAVMLALAQDIDPRDANLDVGYLFFGREELPITQSALLPLFERCAALQDVSLAILLEPTANAVEVGCLGNLNATITVHGRAAHSARPWLGRNAIHAAMEALAPINGLPVHDVNIDGLTFREAVNVTTIGGGVAANVIPDRVRATVNVRYAPGRTPAEAEAWLRGTLTYPDLAIEIDGNAPPGPVVLANALVQRLLNERRLPVRPKQAWTPVAEFAMAGIDAINLGPGDPRYAHTDEEQVELPALMECYDIIRAFLRAPVEG